MARTFYDVLMLSPAADSRLMAVVYRHLAKRYHPDVDRSSEAAARMAELNEAYATLSDRTRRARYDEQIGLAPGRSTQALRGEAGVDAPEGEAGRSATDTGPPAAMYGEAGPPPVNPAPSGAVLTFGRYRGWTLNQVGRFDRDYLEWLARTTMGRNYARELERLLRGR
jgi:curved DNA-binding protein CbpA